MSEITSDLRKWASTFRGVGSGDVADLLESAERKIAANERDAGLAVELEVCASTRDHLPEQKSAAALMRAASAQLLNERIRTPSPTPG